MWNKIKWLVNLYVELKKKSYPLVRLGTNLIIKTPFLVGGVDLIIAFVFPSPYSIFGIEITLSTLSYVSIGLALIVMSTGLLLIYIGIKSVRNQARKTAKVLIVSMLGESANFPNDILFESEKVDSREPIELGLQEGRDYISQSVQMFNSELMVDIYHRFILHQDCKKVFLGGRARIPFLVAYGSCFRNISAKVVYYDQLHQNGKWSLLNDEDKQIKLVYDDIDTVQPNNNGEIGVALGFTTCVENHQLPKNIQDNTLQISTNIQPDRNLIKNQENLERISSKVKMIIDQLSSKQNTKTIHLFLSVQVTVALDIGRNYQEGTHKEWVIYNFDATKGKYIWAIQLNANGIIKKL
jgi:hypothetical protein